jgi:hypothetical protein
MKLPSYILVTLCPSKPKARSCPFPFIYNIYIISHIYFRTVPVLVLTIYFWRMLRFFNGTETPVDLEYYDDLYCKHKT